LLAEQTDEFIITPAACQRSNFRLSNHRLVDWSGVIFESAHHRRVDLQVFTCDAELAQKIQHFFEFVNSFTCRGNIAETLSQRVQVGFRAGEQVQNFLDGLRRDFIPYQLFAHALDAELLQLVNGAIKSTPPRWCDSGVIPNCREDFAIVELGNEFSEAQAGQD
jgi:hypothetical protein